MTLYGLLQLHCTFKILGARVHARFAGHMTNVLSFVKATLVERCYFHTIVQVYKILHLLVPSYIDPQDMFMFSETGL